MVGYRISLAYGAAKGHRDMGGVPKEGFS